MTSLRCAIYTRKSSEEGLEQGFNSLDAQREASAAYILSQAGEGWTRIERAYDDGGYSGGNMDRPGLRQLMADIDAGKIDVVVVYKVDRLTRSLADFARIIEVFDRKGVSFVSVTQAFNTTNSMGRLTLNVLLSFAQFEREVTGERIRDKIAASKAKGLWMGGNPPLGYDPVDQRLVVNATEAELVSRIFQRFLDLGSVIRLVKDLEAAGQVNKAWINRKGTPIGGRPFTRSALYHLLKNPVYLGALRHGTLVHQGAHPPIVSKDIWDRVQALLSHNCPNHPKTPKSDQIALLKDKVFDPRGVPMAVTHSVKRGVHYRYYTARDIVHGGAIAARRLSRISTGALDRVMLAEVPPRLRADYRPDLSPNERIRCAIKRVQVCEDLLTMLLHHEAAAQHLSHLPGRTCDTDNGVEIARPISIKHKHNAMIIEAPDVAAPAGRLDRSLVRALALATRWADRLASGEASALSPMARAEGYCDRHAGKILPLAWLAPDLVQMILDGRQPRTLTLTALTRAPLPIDWDDQRRLVRAIGTGEVR